MPGSKIVDEQEVIRWFHEGWTAPEMIEEYRKKYNIETTPSMWGNFRKRHGLPAKNVRNPELIPWQVEKRHRFRYAIEMLRLEAQRRAGRQLTGEDATRHASYFARLAERNEVIEYRPDTDEGFHLVPRESDDDGVIRRPAGPAHAAIRR